MEQVITVTYTLEKTFLAVATFEGVWVASCQTDLRKCSVLGLYSWYLVSLLWISKQDETKWMLFMRSKPVILYENS